MHHLLYHANCADGFASAIIAQHALTTLHHVPVADICLKPINYPDKGQLPECWHMGDHIYYLDYTPPQTALDMLQRYNGVVALTIIDHHSTAAPRHESPWFTSVFDLSKSGALLTFEHFHPNALIPDAIHLVSWRDLGHAFQQPGHRFSEPAFNLHATLMRATPRTPEDWSPILYTHSSVLLERDLDRGRKLRQFDSNVIASAAMNPLWLQFPTGSTDILSAPASDPAAPPRSASIPIPAITGLGPEIMSEALASVLLHHPSAPFAASWYVDATTGLFTYSLRSRKGGPNVAEIAASMAPGGGGHPHAAGFSTPTPIPFAE